ncbi:hypothetical protein lpa_01482 [Legionella pneumophila 2300/99 Alcoy]|nr:hypothetical protein lpa_01482 [Legionella pneumophila 2300/99 Alcoy]
MPALFEHCAQVNCRTGSLEGPEDRLLVLSIVNCRTGSLEENAINSTPSLMVNCRTGSLEECSFEKIN